VLFDAGLAPIAPKLPSRLEKADAWLESVFSQGAVRKGKLSSQQQGKVHKYDFNPAPGAMAVR